jgi:hypothetical protein
MKQIKDWKQRADYIEEVKEAKFKVSRAINRLESFQVDQIKRVDMEDFVMTRNNNLENLTYLELSDYETYTRSLVYDLTEAKAANPLRYFPGQAEMKRINGEKFKLPLKDKNHKEIKKMFSDLDEGSLGILSISEYRDIVSKNAFPMFVKRHDMRHVHYALSHPRALGTVMGATRSQNHLRFSQLGGMYEAIETVQYGFEQSIAQYFSRNIDKNTFMIMKRNLDLEESMLTLATTPRVFSYGIGEAHGFGSHWRNSVNELQGWVPKSVVNSSNEVILDGSLRMKRGVVDGKEKFIKVAKIKNPDGTIQEVPVYLDSSGKYTSRTEIDPSMTSLNEDIDLMVKNQQEQLEKYNLVRENVIKRANEKNKYWYEVMTEEEEILFHMYNYQKDPNKAAVNVFIKNETGDAVSDISYINEQMINPNGAKWKNDGRAHYSGDGTTGEFGFGSGSNTPGE